MARKKNLLHRKEKKKKKKNQPTLIDYDQMIGGTQYKSSLFRK